MRDQKNHIIFSIFKDFVCNWNYKTITPDTYSLVRATNMDYNKESKLDKTMDAIEDTAEKGAVHLRQEVTSFFMQTSIKGVPRAIKSTNKKLKVVWVIGVLVLLGKTHILLPNIHVDKIQ